MINSPDPSRGSYSSTNLDAAMRAKYGWADQWVAALFDTARSIAIRLEPRGEGKAA